MADLDIFTYRNFRDLLSDYYHTQKKQKASYSYKAFAEKAGLNSPNYLKLVMDGKRNLSHKNIKKFAKGLGLAERRAEFFENLVYFNQTKEEETRSLYQAKLRMLEAGPEAYLLNEEEKEVVTRWYYFVIREMAYLPDFKVDSAWIVKRLNKNITVDQAKEALKVLEKLGLLTNHRSVAVDVSPRMKASAINEFHREMGAQALESVKDDNYEEREFNALTVCVSKENLPLIKERLREFRKELNRFLSNDKNGDEVYQLNLQLFPLTRK